MTTMDSRRRLGSWKEIAAYLGRDVRTALRWHKDRGLPVHRPPGGRGQSVFGYTDEIDAWLRPAPPAPAVTDRDVGPRQAAPPPAPPPAPPVPPARVTRPLAVVTVGVAILLALGLLSKGLPPDSALVKGGRLIALDRDAREVWSIDLPGKDAKLATAPGSGRSIYVGDIDGDDRPEVIVSVVSLRGQPGTADATLHCYEHDGRLRWTRRLDTRLTFGSGEFGPPWMGADLTVFGHGRRTIVWVTHHEIWWPAVVALIAPDGAVTGTFVHAGWITRAEATAEGDRVVLAGISNAQRTTILALVDARHPDGHAPEAAGSPYECLSCPAGAPLRYLRLPRAEAGRVDNVPLDATVIDIDSARTVRLRVTQSRVVRPVPEAIYEFTPDLRLRRASYSDGYWMWHDALARAGSVAHVGAACPERSGPVVEEWVPSTGWRPLPVAASTRAGRER